MKICNDVTEILHKYLDFEIIKNNAEYDSLSQSEKDNLRVLYDKDAKYFYDVKKLCKEKSLFADTIVSFWTPYKRLLWLEANLKVFKTVNSLKFLLDQFDKQTEQTKRMQLINDRIQLFSKVCYTKGNFMLLPNRQMNILRYSLTQDRMDLTLYECFEGGRLARYFESDKKLKEWIYSQKLEGMFINGNICKENINWLTDKRCLITEMKADDIYEYLHNAAVFISSRNKII